MFELIRSRYKITRVLDAQPEYAALQAVDIESREKTEYLLNVYEGALGRRYAGCFRELRHCPEYVEMFLTQGALVTVFQLTLAEDMDAFFYLGAALPFPLRLSYGEQLFHLALRVFEFPPEIACAALFSANLRVLPLDGRLAAHYRVPPLEGVTKREIFFLLYDQAKKILLPRFDTGDAEYWFMEDLRAGLIRGEVSMSALYSRWRAARAEMLAEYEQAQAMNPVGRFLRCIKLNLRRRLKFKRPVKKR